MKTILFFLVMVFSLVSDLFCQDIIIKKSGDTIRAKVLEIGILEIKLKKADDPNGAVISIINSDVSKIIYENGSADVFTDEKSVANNMAAATTENFFLKGQKDAAIYYKGYKPAGTATLIVGVISPIIGLIPAIACSATTPTQGNLMCPNTELLKKADYYDGFVITAKKIKTKKVWSNLGISFGVNVALIIGIIVMAGS